MMELADLQRLHDDYRLKTACLRRPERCADLRDALSAANNRLAALEGDDLRAFLERGIHNPTSVACIVGLFGRLRAIIAQEQARLERGDSEALAPLLAEDVALFRRIAREIRQHYASGVSVEVIGYGEITTSLTLSDRFTLDSRLRPQPYASDWVFKALPKFPNADELRRYRAAFDRYADLLRRAGLELPAQRLVVAGQDASGLRVYIVQRRLDPYGIGNVLIRRLAVADAMTLLRRIILQIAAVYAADLGPIRLGLDGQISNWCCPAPDSDLPLLYIDTSTPLFRVNGVEQINPEIFLKNTPSFMRAVIRRFFLQDVLDRYYDLRRVLIDMIANLYKERRPDLAEPALTLVNELIAQGFLPADTSPLSLAEVKAYYREDAFIWRFFQTARRLDRFVTERLLGRRYPFRLPGKIAR